MKQKIITTLFLLFIIPFTYAQFSQYDWTPKADFGGKARYCVSSFSIGSKGYFAFGIDANLHAYNDLWEYDPATDKWTQKKSCPTNGRYAATAFVINGQAYICFGINLGGGGFFTDLWMYDPLSDSWTQKKTFPGIPRYGASAFVIENKGYVGTGNQGSAAGPFTNELWEYDPSTDNWTQKADLPGPVRYGSMGLTVNDRGYMGLGGRLDNGGYTFFSDFYEYIPSSNSWVQRASITGGVRSYPSGFAIGQYGFVGLGHALTGALVDFWQYTPSGDTWTRVKDFKGQGRAFAGSFGIENKGYYGTGADLTNNSNRMDFWEFGPVELKPDAHFTASQQSCIGQAEKFFSINKACYSLLEFWCGCSSHYIRCKRSFRDSIYPAWNKAGNTHCNVFFRDEGYCCCNNDHSSCSGCLILIYCSCLYRHIG